MAGVYLAKQIIEPDLAVVTTGLVEVLCDRLMVQGSASTEQLKDGLIKRAGTG